MTNWSLIHSQWTSISNPEDSDDGEVTHIQPMKPAKRVRPVSSDYPKPAHLSEKGWTCDSKEPQMAGGCPNQDIIDKVVSAKVVCFHIHPLSSLVRGIDATA